jgi:hypothetical protein
VVSFTPWPLHLWYPFDSKNKANKQVASIFVFASFLGGLLLDLKTDAVHSYETSVDLT